LIMPITCDIGRKERVRALDKFSKGELRALVSSRVLNEGLDVPDADVAIIVGGTFGVRGEPSATLQKGKKLLVDGIRYSAKGCMATPDRSSSAKSRSTGGPGDWQDAAVCSYG